jgi:NAD-dependent dihydropyrimidine dehydrogenase PreA subunit
VAVCPADTLHLGQLKLSSKNENCIGCKFCIITCPADALVLGHEKIV